MAEKFRVTYATLSADNEELQRSYDEAIEEARGRLGGEVPIVIDGREETGDGVYEEPSPIDGDLVVARVHQATREQA
ncbi:MAG TPA: L-glutamate gamma-semialdehyde dehydrogenase, partial [Actinomycetota bacterium]